MDLLITGCLVTKDEYKIRVGIKLALHVCYLHSFSGSYRFLSFGTSYLLHKVYRFLDMCLQSKDSFWTSDAGHTGDMNITQQIVALERKLNFQQSRNLSVRQVKALIIKGPRL